MAILHARTADIEAFREEVMARGGLSPDRVSTAVIGASIGPHVGPGGLWRGVSIPHVLT